MLLLCCITFYSPYIQSLFDFSAILIFPLQGRISLLFSLTFLPRAELRMRNGSAQDFSRHAAHEMKIVIVVGSNITALWGATRQPHVGKFSSELSQSFVLAPQRSWSRRVLSHFAISLAPQKPKMATKKQQQHEKRADCERESARWQHVCCQQHVAKQQTTRRDLFLCFYWSRFLAVELRLLQGESRRRRRWAYSLGNNL